jgi:hypothetical protein
VARTATVTAQSARATAVIRALPPPSGHARTRTHPSVPARGAPNATKLARGRGDVKGSAHMALIEIEEAARRLARAIASDLSLYNAEKIEKGVTNDNLFDEVAADIEEGRALFNSRVSPELYSKNFYDRAIIDLLIRGKGHIRSKMW